MATNNYINQVFDEIKNSIKLAKTGFKKDEQQCLFNEIFSQIKNLLAENHQRQLIDILLKKSQLAIEECFLAREKLKKTLTYNELSFYFDLIPVIPSKKRNIHWMVGVDGSSVLNDNSNIEKILFLNKLTSRCEMNHSQVTALCYQKKKILKNFDIMGVEIFKDSNKIFYEQEVENDPFFYTKGLGLIEKEIKTLTISERENTPVNKPTLIPAYEKMI